MCVLTHTHSDHIGNIDLLDHSTLLLVSPQELIPSARGGRFLAMFSKGARVMKASFMWQQSVFGRQTYPCRVAVHEPSVDPVERFAVKSAHTAVTHTKPQSISLVPINGPHRSAGQTILRCEVRQRLAIESPCTTVACSKPDVASSVFYNREYSSERTAGPLFPDAESVLFGEVNNTLAIVK